MAIKKFRKWQFELHLPKGSADGVYQVLDKHNVIAIVDPDGAQSDYGEAYAQAIAAVPELIAALQFCYERLQVLDDAEESTIQDQQAKSQAKSALINAGM